MRNFNISGPCFKEEHYMIEAVTCLKGVERLIDTEKYFVIHAAPRSGKTTYLKDLTERLNAAGKYYVLYCSLEGLQNIEDYEKGIPGILDYIESALKLANIPFTCYPEYEKDKYIKQLIVLKTFFTELSRQLDKPLVILFDEADCLSEGTLISFLRQLREGHNSRPESPFVHSIALVGMRNIRDYKAKIRPDSESLGSASPFNIVTETFTLKNFTREEIASLYRQHTDETGQQFEDGATDIVWQQTQGQPWLVNAIARESIKILDYDYTKPLTGELVKEAIQSIILRRYAHIDSLMERLKEERVMKVIEPVITGGYVDATTDDYLYATDLGLIRMVDGSSEPSNPIYAEIMARSLNSNIHNDLLQNKSLQMARYLKNGRIDMDYLMRDFQQFWRENSEIWVERFNYKEAAPHLILMAFLQRISNGGGRIVREMGSGKGRADLCLIYENEKYPVELKIRYGEKTLREGLVQTAEYMDAFGCNEGWLAIFDRRQNLKWEEKIYMHKESVDGKTITVIGL